MEVEDVNERTGYHSGSSSPSPASKDVNERTGCCSGSSSPTSKVKFLCSHGGKILPRPVDGSLKYVGGETRVIAVPRDITFSELMKKLSALADGEMVLKYQLVTEDLDTLVSVRTDEDLKHMFNEYDRNGGGGTSMLRTFLFHSRPVVLENQPPVLDPHLLEQRYIDAINSIVRVNNMGRFSPARAFSGSPAYSTPRSPSPDDHTDYLMDHEMILFNGSRSTQVPMHKVQSFPNICSLNSPNHSPNHSNAPNHSPNHNNGYSGLNPNHSPNHSNGYSGLNMQPYDHSFCYNLNHHQHYPHGYPPYRMAQESPMAAGPGKPPLSSSPGRADIPLSFSPGGADICRGNCFNPYLPTSRRPRGTGGYSVYTDEYTGYVVKAGEASFPEIPRKRVAMD